MSSSSADGHGVGSPLANGCTASSTSTTNSTLSSSSADPLSISVNTSAGLVNKCTLYDMSPSFQSQLSSSNAPPFGYKRETSHRVFVNRSLYLGNMRFIGFDMDYTLAQYMSPNYEALQFRMIMQHLVALGYPEAILQYEYDECFPIRGLWFDKQFGNLLKVDPFGNILACCHGFTFLRPHEVRELYPNKFVSFDESRFYIMNTLFQLPETYIYACLVAFFTTSTGYTPVSNRTGVNSGEIFMSFKSIFQSVRKAFDWLHTNSELQSIVTSNVRELVQKDPRLPLLLDRYRERGLRIFLLTNSAYEYTNGIMTYLLDKYNEKGELERAWVSYFDYVVVDACKPLFFEEGTIIRVVDKKTRNLSIGCHVGPLKQGAVYSGGNCDQFSELIGSRGKDVLYIGDHIFGDILKSKKKRGWRTFLVVPELMRELFVWKERGDTFIELQAIDAAIGEKYRNLDSSSTTKPDTSELENRIRDVAFKMDMEYGKFGSLFRSGSRQTFFAAQVMRFADLYSHSFLNLLYYPFCYMFRAPFILMPHESTEAHEPDARLGELVAEHQRQLAVLSRSRTTSLSHNAPIGVGDEESEDPESPCASSLLLPVSPLANGSNRVAGTNGAVGATHGTAHEKPQLAASSSSTSLSSSSLLAPAAASPQLPQPPPQPPQSSGRTRLTSWKNAGSGSGLLQLPVGLLTPPTRTTINNETLKPTSSGESSSASTSTSKSTSIASASASAPVELRPKTTAATPVAQAAERAVADAALPERERDSKQSERDEALLVDGTGTGEQVLPFIRPTRPRESIACHDEDGISSDSDENEHHLDKVPEDGEAQRSATASASA